MRGTGVLFLPDAKAVGVGVAKRVWLTPLPPIAI